MFGALVEGQGRGVAANITKMLFVRVLVNSLALTVPTCGLYWMDNGLSLSDVMLLQAMFALCVIVFEVPSGYFADVHDRRVSIGVGGLMLTIGALVYGLAQGFWDFFVAEMFLALGFAFISGADQALLYDSLIEVGEEKKFSQVWGRQVSLEIGLTAVGCVVGAYISAYSFRLPYFLSAVCFVFVCITAFSMEEPPRSSLDESHGHAAQLWRAARFSFFDNRKLGWLMAFSSVIAAFVGVVVWLYQPYMTHLGMSMQAFGWVYFVMNVVAAFVSMRAASLERRMGERWCCVGMVMLLATSFILLAHVVTAWSWIFFLMHQVVRGFARVVFSEAVNVEALSDLRATINSLRSMSERLTYTIVLLVNSLAIESLGLLGMMQCLGLLIVSLALGLSLVRPRA